MALQDTILALRKEHGLSQEDLAQELFVTRQAVSRWENGETSPTIDMLKMIAEKYDVDANALLGLAEAPICQSCAMPLQQLDDFGTENDDSANLEYCIHCFKKGAFTHERTIDEMIESNLRSLEEFNTASGTNYTEEEARSILKMHLATLKRWQHSN